MPPKVPAKRHGSCSFSAVAPCRSSSALSCGSSASSFRRQRELRAPTRRFLTFATSAAGFGAPDVPTLSRVQRCRRRGVRAMLVTRGVRRGELAAARSSRNKHDPCGGWRTKNHSSGIRERAAYLRLNASSTASSRPRNSAPCRGTAHISRSSDRGRGLLNIGAARIAVLCSWS